MLHLFGSEFTNATRAATRSFSLISLSGRFGNPASVVILTRSAGCCAGSFWCVPQPASRRGSTRAKPILLILPGGQSWDGPEDGAPSDRDPLLLPYLPERQIREPGQRRDPDAGRVPE